MKKLMIIGLLFMLFSLLACASPTSTHTSIPSMDSSPEMQAKRLNLINKLISEGIFYKVEKPGDYAHVWLTPLFHSLDFEDKESFVSVVYAYYISRDSKADTVILYDSKTGKHIGVYAELYGGLKLD